MPFKYSYINQHNWFQYRSACLFELLIASCALFDSLVVPCASVDSLVGPCPSHDSLVGPCAWCGQGCVIKWTIMIFAIFFDRIILSLHYIYLCLLLHVRERYMPQDSSLDLLPMYTIVYSNDVAQGCWIVHWAVLRHCVCYATGYEKWILWLLHQSTQFFFCIDHSTTVSYKFVLLENAIPYDNTVVMKLLVILCSE